MMSEGKLGSASLTANTDIPIYTVPNGRSAVINISVVNCGDTTTSFTAAIAESGSPTPKDFIVHRRQMPPSGELERTGIWCSPGERIIARATTGSVSVRVHGVEEEL